MSLVGDTTMVQGTVVCLNAKTQCWRSFQGLGERELLPGTQDTWTKLFIFKLGDEKNFGLHYFRVQSLGGAPHFRTPFINHFAPPSVDKFLSRSKEL